MSANIHLASDRELIISRLLDAPRELVFKAGSNPSSHATPTTAAGRNASIGSRRILRRESFHDEDVSRQLPLRDECDLDLAAGSRRCNCSFCWKTRFWKAFAMAGEFRLLQGADMLSDYQASPSEWPEGHVHHYFCSRCGVRAFSKGYLEMPPFNGEFHAVNLAALDDATDAELATTPVQFEDGRGNRWDSSPGETRYL